MYSFMDSKENISNAHQILHFLSEPWLSSAYDIGGLIFSCSLPSLPISPKLSNHKIIVFYTKLMVL